MLILQTDWLQAGAGFHLVRRQQLTAERLREFAAIDIPMVNGGSTTVDIADIPITLRSRWRWCQPKSGVRYARSTRRINGKLMLLHRLLMSAKTDQQIDHKDGNGLNNRRSNIRLASSSQNNANRGVQRRNKLGIKGVARVTRSRKYQARIGERHLGTFDTKEQAQAAYERAAHLHYGEFARCM